MSVILTGSAKERVSGANGFINEVTDPNQFISRMPATSSDVISDIGDIKSLKEMLEDKGNPVFIYHKDGSKQFHEYYKGDYELALVSFMSEHKNSFNRIISREEALTMLIDKEYPSISIPEKLALAALDTKADMAIIKTLWNITDKTSSEPYEEDVYTEGTQSAYPQLAEAGTEERLPITVQQKELKKSPIFRKAQSTLYISTSIGDIPLIDLIDANECIITVTGDIISLDPEDSAVITINNKTTINALASGVSFMDTKTDRAYTIFVKD